MAAGSALKPERKLAIGRAQVSVFETKQNLFEAAAEVFFGTVGDAIAEGGRCTIALAGGSTPKALYSMIAKRADQQEDLRRLDWRNVHFFFGDERGVPPDHADSNYGMVLGTLLKHGLVPPRNVHRILAEKGVADAALLYEQEIKKYFDGPPKFHLILLGIGSDGHTASLFPGTAALDVRDHLVTANLVPQMKAERVTLTYPAINAAARVLFMVAGDDKKQAIESLFVRHADLPAAHVQPAGDLLWYLDREAAALLPA